MDRRGDRSRAALGLEVRGPGLGGDHQRGRGLGMGGEWEGGGYVELVEELAVAARAEGYLEGRGGDDTDRALALVAPEQAAGPTEVERHDSSD